MVNEYIGKICPFCKSKLAENDDIVVCSACEMPHHKECWIENQGCTTFGCLGTIDGVDNQGTSVPAREIPFGADTPINNSPVYCTHCGSQNHSAALFCGSCGSRLSTKIAEVMDGNSAQQLEYQHNSYSANPTYSPHTRVVEYEYTQPTENDSEIIRFVGPNVDFYVPKFKEMTLWSKKDSWNWAAFLFGPYWFIYRKMYEIGFAMLAAIFVFSLTPLVSLFVLGGYIVAGIFANYIYMKELERKARKAEIMSEPFKSQYIFSNSGVNTNTTLITAIGYAVLVGIVFM